ncbi:MAG: GNAT family N-acetyltransferase [Marinilabiliaceae bacterium]|nr:GNAT family N-acetyltransferase [Marinilabiliaceae bacterium]
MIKGEKIILRVLSQNDWQKTLLWRNDPEIKNLAMMHPFPVSEELEKLWYASNIEKVNNNLVVFGIELVETKELVGFTKLYDINWIHRYAYFGIVIGEKQARGMGIGKETTLLMIRYAFDVLNLNKIMLEVIDTNENAKKLYQHIGFKIEGKLKNQIFTNGSYNNVIIMALFNLK